MTEYTTWDYDINLATVYERHGECNGCGACCKALIRFKYSDPDIKSIGDPCDGGRSTTELGKWHQASVDAEGKPRYFNFIETSFPEGHRCIQLTDDNRCQMHFDKNKLCSDFPFAPENVIMFPECSYTFSVKERFPVRSESEHLYRQRWRLMLAFAQKKG